MPSGHISEAGEDPPHHPPGGKLETQLQAKWCWQTALHETFSSTAPSVQRRAPNTPCICDTLRAAPPNPGAGIRESGQTRIVASVGVEGGWGGHEGKLDHELRG